MTLEEKMHRWCMSQRSVVVISRTYDSLYDVGKISITCGIVIIVSIVPTVSGV